MVRGEVFHLPPPRGSRGHEQRGARHCVVVQADELLALSTVLVAPTSTRAAPATFRPAVEISGLRVMVLVEQIRVVDAQKLGRSAGRLSRGEMRSVEEAMRLVFALT